MTKYYIADGKFGKPFVEGAKVTGVVEKQGKGKKITIVKYKAKNLQHVVNKDTVNLTLV